MLAKSNSIIKGYMPLLLVGLNSFDNELDLGLGVLTTKDLSGSNNSLYCSFIVLIKKFIVITGG